MAVDQTIERPDQTALGIALVVASVFVMAFADSLVKLVSADITLWQIFAARSVVAAAVIALLLRYRGKALRPKRGLWAWTRNILLMLTWLTYYASLPALDLSVAAVAMYTTPIMIALLSAAWIGERVTAPQWGGVGLGFIGVLAILRPGTEAFSWFTLLPILGAAFYAFSQVMTRSKCRDEDPLVLGFLLHIVFLVTGIAGAAVLLLLDLSPESRALYPFLFDGWPPVTMEVWGLMAFLGLLAAGYFVGVAKAYQIAPPSIIATFDYGYLVSAAIWGIVFFADYPDSSTLAGMALITAAGLLVSRTGRRQKENPASG